jgi:drug/metabolite transporter (DMT)-like permease
MSKSKKVGGVLLVALSAASFGLMPIFAKIAYSAATSTYSLLFLRFSLAAAFLFLSIFLKKLPLPSKREMLVFCLLGAVGYVGTSFCYFYALNYASAGIVSLLLYTYPALVMVGSAILFKERVTLPKVIALCLALVGACIIIGTEFQSNLIGIILSILAALFYSSYILISSKSVKEGMGIQSSAFITLGAAVIYGTMNLFMGFSPPTQFDGFMAVAMITMISTVLAFWSFFTGIKKTGPSTASLVSILEPVVTVLASAIILSEKITSNMLLGGCLVLISLVVTLLPTKKHCL